MNIPVPDACSAKDAGRQGQKADMRPRKVAVASALARFSGSLEERLSLGCQLIDEAALKARAVRSSLGLDLMVFPEFMLLREGGATAAERAVDLAGDVLERLGQKAREHHTWVVVPMILREAGPPEKIRNAAVLLNRSGEVAGVYHKVHCMLDEHCVAEGGVVPGVKIPVFNCDFGRLGILVCWDMAYEEAWSALAAASVDIVALPSSSPQTLRPMSQALRHGFYVVTSTPRDNASLFDPLGRVVAQRCSHGVCMHRIDLSFALLHWSKTLREGRALAERFGESVGYDYSEREDTGVFWSNDPQRSIGSMIRELGLIEMSDLVDRVRRNGSCG